MREPEVIALRGVRVHNLKNISIDLPRNCLVVITGLSGSGKSSLAFDTLYAEGQRRYVESLNAYARQFLDRMERPDVDAIEGLSPAISIEQRNSGRNPRSTVGTVTEIYDYLRVLFARIGVPHCPTCGEPITRQSVDQMVDRILAFEEGTRILVQAPLVRSRKGAYRELFERLRREGFVRVVVDGEQRLLEEPIELDPKVAHDVDLVVDRLVVRVGARGRLADSVETALRYGDGLVRVVPVGGGEPLLLSSRLACVACGTSVPEMHPRNFSFNAPQGACPTCNGLGVRQVFDPGLVVPDPHRSIAGGAIAPLRGHFGKWLERTLRTLADTYGFRLDVPFADLSPEVQRLILYGPDEGSVELQVELRSRSGRSRFSHRTRFEGVIPRLERRYLEAGPRAREELERYMTEQLCPDCRGARLRPEYLAVRIAGRNIAEVAAMNVLEAAEWLESLRLGPRDAAVAERVLGELRERLRFLIDVGLGYLTLDRRATTLSGGEDQRIRLATQLGNALTGVLYILDEPSIGLHPADHARLLRTLQRLRDRGNTVVVVEHDEMTIRAADWVVDLGPGAGKHGGEVVAEGPPERIAATPDSLTGAYLAGRRRIPLRRRRREPAGWIEIHGARAHNLKAIDVRIPRGTFVCVTGVSGSGKSSLVIDTLYKAAAVKLNGARRLSPGPHDAITGLGAFRKVVEIDQAPIGRTPRSNPATYVDLFTPIRQLFAGVPEARARGFRPGRFSFNVPGGRCEACEGSGVVRIEMHFLPDVFVTCEACEGRRYNRETLEIRYRGLDIAEVLELTIDEAAEFFAAVPVLRRRLGLLQEVGLGYLQLGQPATTLSGGEAQRIKLAKELSRRNSGDTLYILDEPTTGLHIEDVRRLLDVLQRLVDAGNTVVVIEHHLDVVAAADWIVDLGPAGGEAGGRLVAEGPPETIAANPDSVTGRHLREHLERRRS